MCKFYLTLLTNRTISKSSPPDPQKVSSNFKIKAKLISLLSSRYTGDCFIIKEKKLFAD